MELRDEIVLVFGATGQQGGSVADALLAQRWRVRALVRDPDAAKARSLAARGVELARGDFADVESIRAALAGTYGVFSVQPSSGQGAAYGVTDADEIRYGKGVGRLAAEAGVRHFVYSSANAAGPTKCGVGHFDTKGEIEDYVRGLPMASTVVRPSAFLELLTLPGMGLDRGAFEFLMSPDRPMQFLAVRDVGRVVAGAFADPLRYASRTFEIAGDAVTGRQLAEKFGRALGKSITYSRFPDAVLDQNPFLGSLARLVDEGRLAGHADLAALREQFPGLLTTDDWLARDGRLALLAASRADGEVALR